MYGAKCEPLGVNTLCVPLRSSKEKCVLPGGSKVLVNNFSLWAKFHPEGGEIRVKNNLCLGIKVAFGGAI
jgi:hypothetical protein